MNVAHSIAKLKELLATNTPDLVMGMIHKFQEHELMHAFPVLNTSENILVMIDEALLTAFKNNSVLFGKRMALGQELMELAFHLYGPR